MTQDNAILYILGYGIAFLIAVFVTRAIFSIPKFLKIQKAQLQVLAEIALQQGVNAEVLRTIREHHQLDARERTNEEIRLAAKKDSQLTPLDDEALSYKRAE